jgi:predicted SpoU family rRNA methylase
MTTLEQTIDRAAETLPDDWIVEINIEAGSGTVNLYDKDGCLCHLSGYGTINEQVLEAIDYAMEHDKL